MAKRQSKISLLSRKVVGAACVDVVQQFDVETATASVKIGDVAITAQWSNYAASGGADCLNALAMLANRLRDALDDVHALQLEIEADKEIA